MRIGPVTRGRHRRTATIATAAVAGLATAFCLSGPAAGASRQPAATVYHVCQYRAQNLCLVPHGGGQYTMGSSSFADFTKINVGNNGVMFQNAAGKCLFENGNYQVVGSAHPCRTRNQYEIWQQSENGPVHSVELDNLYYGLAMYVLGLSPGQEVYAGAPQNNYHLWRYFQATG